jgi:hypothetical protein
MQFLGFLNCIFGLHSGEGTALMKTKFWVGVGAAALLGGTATGVLAAGTAPVQMAQAHGHHGAAIVQKAAEGEGEGGNADREATLSPALRFHRDLQLVRGHLLVGDELMREKRLPEALPHVLHPIEELYGRMRDSLKTFGVPPFLNALKALAQTVKARNPEAYQAALVDVNRRLDAAEAQVRQAQQGSSWPAFVGETILEMIEVAAEEYEASIEKGRFAKPVEYQDSRGFVWRAEQLLEQVSDEFGRKDAASLATTRQAFAELKKAWPSAMPPARPVMEPGQVLSAVSRLELALGGLLR